MAYVKSEEERLSILKQVAFKGAIELCCHGKIGYGNYLDEAESAFNWLKNPLKPRNLLGGKKDE